MKLKDLINEMSMPVINDPEKAAETIRQAYTVAVIKKKPNADLYGPLSAALKFFQDSPNAVKYQREIKMGIAAKKAMDAFRKTKATQQAQFTTVK